MLSELLLINARSLVGFSSPLVALVWRLPCLLLLGLSKCNSVKWRPAHFVQAGGPGQEVEPCLYWFFQTTTEAISITQGILFPNSHNITLLNYWAVLKFMSSWLTYLVKLCSFWFISNTTQVDSSNCGCLNKFMLILHRFWGPLSILAVLITSIPWDP